MPISQQLQLMLPSDHRLEMRLKDDAILVQISLQGFRAQNFRNLDKLILIVPSMEEWFLSEDLV